MFDPFETLGIDKKFSIDMQVLDKRYFETLMKTHPDRLRDVGEDEKKLTLQKAGEVNKAYGILKDPVQRAMILLKDAGNKPLDHDPLFLGEVMNWNERIVAGEDLRDELVQEGEELMLSLTEAFQSHDYKKIKVALYRLTYVRNLLISVGEEK